jgi:putative spermidine/putrescine transport system permease protein
MTVEWRWLLPVVLETGIIIFAFILAAFEVPYLLGATYPKMLPVLAYQWFFEGDWSNRPLAMASMVILTVFIVTIALFVLSMTQKMRYRMMRGN